MHKHKRNCLPPMTEHPPGSSCCTAPLPACAEIDAFDLGQHAGKLPPQQQNPKPEQPQPPGPGWKPCNAGLESGWINPENGICIPESVIKGSAAPGPGQPGRLPEQQERADQTCYTTGRIPGGVNPITGTKYPSVTTGFCCKGNDQWGGPGCITFKHTDVS